MKPTRYEDIWIKHRVRFWVTWLLLQAKHWCKIDLNIPQMSSKLVKNVKIVKTLIAYRILHKSLAYSESVIWIKKESDCLSLLLWLDLCFYPLNTNWPEYVTSGQKNSPIWRGRKDLVTSNVAGAKIYHHICMCVQTWNHFFLFFLSHSILMACFWGRKQIRKFMMSKYDSLISTLSFLKKRNLNLRKHISTFFK